MVFFCVFVLLLNQFCGIHLCKIERFGKPEVNGYCNSHKDADISIIIIISNYLRFLFFYFLLWICKEKLFTAMEFKSRHSYKMYWSHTRSFHNKSLQTSSNKIVLCGKIVLAAKVNRGSQRVVHKWTEHKGGQRLFQQNNERFSKSIMNPGSINLVRN